MHSSRDNAAQKKDQATGKREVTCLQTSVMQMSRSCSKKEIGDTEKEEGNELNARKTAGTMGYSEGSRLLDR